VREERELASTKIRDWKKRKESSHGALKVKEKGGRRGYWNKSQNKAESKAGGCLRGTGERARSLRAMARGGHVRGSIKCLYNLKWRYCGVEGNKECKEIGLGWPSQENGRRKRWDGGKREGSTIGPMGFETTTSSKVTCLSFFVKLENIDPPSC